MIMLSKMAVTATK